MRIGNGIRYLKAILLGMVFVCLCRLGQAYCLSVEHQKRQEELKKMAQAETTLQESDSEGYDREEGGSAEAEDGTAKTGIVSPEAEALMTDQAMKDRKQKRVCKRTKKRKRKHNPCRRRRPPHTGALSGIVSGKQRSGRLAFH